MRVRSDTKPWITTHIMSLMRQRRREWDRGRRDRWRELYHTISYHIRQAKRDTASNIEEVGGFSSVQLDDVHGGHGEAGTIDQTPDVPVQLDVVEAVLGGLHLPRVRLGRVLHLKYMFLSEGSIVIKSKLGISSVYL